MTRALIAEDEPLLAAALAAELGRQWPTLELLPPAGDGPTVVARALSERPELVFLDIRMPGCSGLDAAAAIVEEWPHAQPLPLIVFVTAYDQHALEAFERHAVDYLLKPVLPERLARCCERLQALLARRTPSDALRDEVKPELLVALQKLLGEAPAPVRPVLNAITAAVGNTVHRIPLEAVLCFEAADKYVRVLTAEREFLIRTPLRELLPQLPDGIFEQIHRSVLVRADAIASVVRDDNGRLQLRLSGLPQVLPVSRLYAHRFKAM